MLAFRLISINLCTMNSVWREGCVTWWIHVVASTTAATVAPCSYHIVCVAVQIPTHALYGRVKSKLASMCICLNVVEREFINFVWSCARKYLIYRLSQKCDPQKCFDIISKTTGNFVVKILQQYRQRQHALSIDFVHESLACRFCSLGLSGLL